MTIAEPIVPSRRIAIPPLESGDQLTRDEFERRYDAMPDLKKAELIEGVVFMPSPVSGKYHGKPHADTIRWLGAYQFGTPGTEVHCESSVRLSMESEPQPDALLFIASGCGGQVRIAARGFVEGAPELVMEVASSSVSIDLHAKRRVYERCGVREYVVWRVLDETVDWFVVRGGQFEPLSPNAEGRLCSEVFPGLWLDPAALVRGDLVTVMQVVQQGLATKEHAAFVEWLRTGSEGTAIHSQQGEARHQ